MKSNFLNLLDSELDKPVYRIFEPTRLFDIFDTGRMGLVKPQVWDDPFENYILNATGFLPDGKSFVIGDRDHLYCQCWSHKKESDAMWRIYSPKPDHAGIKVSSTPRKLLAALYASSGNFRNISCFIGKVSYKVSKKLVEYFENNAQYIIIDSTGKLQASTLLLKRLQFSHEKEIRLIFHDVEKQAGNVFSFPVDATELFDSITFDPNLPNQEFRIKKNQLVSYGFKKPIIRSKLYDKIGLRFNFTL